MDLNGDEELAIASVATIGDRSGAFKEAAEWNTLDIMNSGTDVESVLSTANSLYGDQVVGFANYPDGDGSVEPLSSSWICLKTTFDRPRPTVLPPLMLDAQQAKALQARAT